VKGLYAVGEGPELGPGRRVATAAQMRTIDSRAIGEFGVNIALLMENAGRAVATAAEHWMEEQGNAGPVLVLCGPGNNGGDGFVCARTLRARGHTVILWRLVGPGDEKEPAPEVQLHRALWEGAGGKTRTLDGGAGEMGSFADGFAALESAIGKAGVVLDAVFGTGLSRPVGAPFAEVFGAIVASGKPCIALDVPSGMDADTGAALGVLLPAVLTVTFGALKSGLFRGEAAGSAGAVLAAEIGLPPALLADLEVLGAGRPER